MTASRHQHSKSSACTLVDAYLEPVWNGKPSGVDKAKFREQLISKGTIKKEEVPDLRRGTYQLRED